MAESTETILFNLKIEENRATRKLQEVKEAVNSLDRRTTKYKNTVREQIALETKLTQIRKQRITANKQLEVSSKGLTKAQMQQQDATGSATSATMELSRVISDAPYGIRGMANNITQLVSQLGTASTKAGGLTAALKLMWKQLTGPLGVVFAITAAVSALDYFFGANEKAEKSTNKQTKALNKQISALQKLNNIYNVISGNLFADSDNEALDKYNKGLLTTEETVKIVSRNFNEFSNAYEKLTDEQKKDEKNVKTLLRGYQELLSLKEKEKTQMKGLQELRKIVDKQDAAILSRKKRGYKVNEDAISREKTQLGLLEKDYIATQKRLVKLEEFFSKQKEDKKPKGRKKTLIKLIDPTDFDAQSKDLMSKVNSVNQQIELALAESEEDKFNIRFRYQQNALQLEKANYIQSINDKYDKELEKYEELVASKKMSEEALALWKQNAEDNRDKAIDETVSKYDGLFDLFDKLRKARISAMGGADDESKVKELEGLQFYVDAYKEIMGSVSGFLSAESDRELTIEQNKTNALNAELNDRLLNEKLSADQRKGIQNQIWQNDEALRKRQNEIKKKKFNTEKAFNIAIATADTIAAGVSAAKATYGGPVAKIVAMTATIGAGLAQVAVIARQKFQPDSASTPINTASGGGGGGGVGDRSFDFNLVGNTQENQLANAIQSQFSTPLQAFVVSKDITTQQELDLNIKSSATF